MRHPTIALTTGAAIAALIVACGDSGRPVDIPTVPAGAYEADCQRLCTRAGGEDTCTAEHAEFCLAECRARTNGLLPACASCLVAAGEVIHGDADGFGDPICVTGGPSSLGACRTECDDAGAAAPDPSLASFCDLTCGFYMADADPLACSEDGSADCRSKCAATIAARGRICAQCTIEQTGTSRICINDDCDCEPLFDETPPFGCDELCDSSPPQV
jgi:hypothetical protein